LLNDLNWYLTRFVDEALVQEPSISDAEALGRWLNGSETAKPSRRKQPSSARSTASSGSARGPSRTTVVVLPSQRGRVPRPTAIRPLRSTRRAETRVGTDDSDSSEADRSRAAKPTHRLVEPLYVRRTGGELPEYDLRDVEDTLVVRLTEAEYSP